MSLRRIAATLCSEMQQPRSLKDWTFPEEFDDASANVYTWRDPSPGAMCTPMKSFLRALGNSFRKKFRICSADERSARRRDEIPTLGVILRGGNQERNPYALAFEVPRNSLVESLPSQSLPYSCRSASIFHAMLCDSASFARSVVSPAPCQKRGRSNSHQLETQQTHGTQVVCSSSQWPSWVLSAVAHGSSSVSLYHIGFGWQLHFI